MIDHLDHLVLTTTNLDATLRFYVGLLGMRHEQFGNGRHALKFGKQKINLHERGSEFEPKAHLPVPGALDLCFISSIPLDEAIAHITEAGGTIIEGPVLRTGATHRLRSIYLRDPDLNLIEISEELPSD